MRLIRSNTAVVVAVGPFFDKADGVTIKSTLSITNEKITLVSDTDDGVAPTMVIPYSSALTTGVNALNYISGGASSGMMQLSLTAGNTSILGRMFLSITDSVNHVPVFHEFMVVPAIVYDNMYRGIINGASYWI
jgi:hypothetical protein